MWPAICIEVRNLLKGYGRHLLLGLFLMCLGILLSLYLMVGYNTVEIRGSLSVKRNSSEVLRDFENLGNISQGVYGNISLLSSGDASVLYTLYLGNNTLSYLVGLGPGESKVIKLEGERPGVMRIISHNGTSIQYCISILLPIRNPIITAISALMALTGAFIALRATLSFYYKIAYERSAKNSVN
ncbi:MAG: hypothetical protein ACP5JF_02095 [Candidatus Methanodesulfokora sp.]